MTIIFPFSLSSLHTSQSARGTECFACLPLSVHLILNRAGSTHPETKSKAHFYSPLLLQWINWGSEILCTQNHTLSFRWKQNREHQKCSKWPNTAPYSVSCLASHLVGNLILSWTLPSVVISPSTHVILSPPNHLLRNDHHLTFYVYLHLLTCSLSVCSHRNVNSMSAVFVFLTAVSPTACISVWHITGIQYLLNE